MTNEIQIGNEKKELKINAKKEKKGVGYSAQVGEIWDVDKYIKSKKVKSDQISILLVVVTNFISCEKWEPDEWLCRDCLCGIRQWWAPHTDH